MYFLIKINYLGKNFYGSSKQKHTKLLLQNEKYITVQSFLEIMLTSFTGEKCELNLVSRTDKRC